MKILIIQSPFMPVNVGGTSFGGIEVFVNDLATVLCDMSHEVELVLTGDYTITPEYKDKIKVHATPCPSKEQLNKDHGKGTRYKYNELIGILTKLNFSDYDYIVNNSDKVSINKALMRIVLRDQAKADRELPYKVISYIHNPPLYRGSDKCAMEFYNIVEACKGDIIFYTNSQLNKIRWDDMIRSVKGISKEDNADNPITFISKIQPILVKDVAKHITGFSPEPASLKSFVSIGRLSLHKRAKFYTQIADEYNKLTSDTTWAWFGGGTEEDVELNGFNGDTIALLQLNKSNKDKRDYFEANRPFTVTTSVDECFGMTATESFSLGLPIIVVDHPANNIRYIVLDEDRGAEILFEKDEFTITSLGMLIKNGSASEVARRIKDAMDMVSELDLYDSQDAMELTKVFYNHYCIENEKLIDEFFTSNSN